MNDLCVAYAPAYQACCADLKCLYIPIDVLSLPGCVYKNLRKFNNVIAGLVVTRCSNKAQECHSFKFCMDAMNIDDLETFEGIIEDQGKWSIIGGNRHSLEIVPSGTLSNEYELSLQYLVDTGRFCSDCHAFTELRSNKWVCSSCGKCVSCHSGTDRAMGSVADSNIRDWRRRAHLAFDRIWKDGLLSRERCYRELTHVLGMPADYTHIGVLTTEEQLKKTIEWSKERYNKIKGEKL